MSYLVSDFIINPVLRQARRFSRSSSANDRIDPLTNRRTTYEANTSYNEATILEGRESGGSDPIVGHGGESSTGDILGHVSDRPIVSSPIEEQACLEAELLPPGNNGSNNASESTELSSRVPPHLASLFSSQVTIEDDVSDNPSFGIPRRFQTISPMSTSSYNSISRHQTMSSADGLVTHAQDPSQPTGSSSGTRQRNKSLPEDDGMGSLRQRILTIQKMDVAAGEKARLMHQLLTGGYTQSQINQQAKLAPLAQSPISTVSQERPTTPMSLGSFSFWQKSLSDTPPKSSPTGSHKTIQLSQDDLTPTYVPRDPHPAVSSNSADAEEIEQAGSFGCLHYRRNVKLQCFTCSRWYTCRFCHDEVEDHHVNRKETRNMLCMLCGCAQRAGDTCVDCGMRAAWYYCSVCHLWDDDANKSIYHCNDCGICRRGLGIGKDYIHCKVSYIMTS
jgi:uncharacterized CHY-type Zn-finger protein